MISFIDSHECVLMFKNPSFIRRVGLHDDLEKDTLRASSHQNAVHLRSAVDHV